MAGIGVIWRTFAVIYSVLHNYERFYVKIAVTKEKHPASIFRPNRPIWTVSFFMLLCNYLLDFLRNKKKHGYKKSIKL